MAPVPILHIGLFRGYLCFNDMINWKAREKISHCRNRSKKYHIVGTDPKFNRKIVEKSKIDASNIHVHDCSLSCLGIDTSIKSYLRFLVFRFVDIARIYIYIFIWKNYPFTTGATTIGVAVVASKICLHIIQLYTVYTKNNIYSEMPHNFSLKYLSFC